MMEEFIAKIPKAELLVHIEGTIEPELMLELAKRNKISIPYTSLEDIRKAYQFKDLKSFLEIYYAGISVLVTEQDFYDLTFAYLQQCAAQNVRHVEVSFDAQAHMSRGLALTTIITGIRNALMEGEKQFHLSTQLIMCIQRGLSSDAAQQVLQQAVEFKDWIVAIGLDSEETNDPPVKFKSVFTNAREYGFLTVAAAGEVGPSEYIWQAIDELHVSRIGYGVRCVEDTDLIDRLAVCGTPISMCPLSNVKTQAVASIQKHPIKKMMDEGLTVTVNSDDPAYFGSLTENYKALCMAFKFSKANIYELIKNSFNSSFLDAEKLNKYLKELDDFYH